MIYIVISYPSFYAKYDFIYLLKDLKTFSNVCF
jgi:hypothetical protein